jgi:uncharacterized protein YjdB
MKKVLLLATLMIGGMFTTACKVTEVVKGPSIPADSVVTLTINPSVLVTTVGQTTQLVAEPKNAIGNPVTKSVVWTTSDPTKAIVSSTGVVTGVAAGAAYIRATVDGITTQVPVAISEVPVSVILLTPSSSTILVGQSITPTVSLRGPNNQVLTNRFVGWTSSNSTIASVSALGTITGISSGTATITATSEGKLTTFTVTVTMTAVSSAEISSAATVFVGRSTSLQLILRDASGNVLPLVGRTVVWSTSDSTRLSVSSTGVVTGLATGTVTIVALVEGKVGVFSTTVGIVPIVTVGIISPDSTPMRVGSIRQFTATAFDMLDNPLTPAALVGRQFVWSTDTPSRIAVSANGLVTATTPGAATLRVTIDGLSRVLTIVITN